VFIIKLVEFITRFVWITLAKKVIEAVMKLLVIYLVIAFVNELVRLIMHCEIGPHRRTYKPRMGLE
jgi:hypothetical protein